MSSERVVLVLDSLFDDLSIETDAAAARGWSMERWNGSDAQLGTADVAVHVRTRVDEMLLARMPNCRVVGRFGTGLDSVDMEACTRRGIAVVGVRDYCTPELTAHTLALAFALERRLLVADGLRLDASATWDDIERALPIVGRTRAAVVGFGTIGRSVSRALLAMGYAVMIVTEHGASEAHRIGAAPVALDTALRSADAVFLHAALDARTAGLIDAEQLALMRPDALLVDTARLGLIDEEAVAEALMGDRLGGVAIDARLAPESPLIRLAGDPRLIVTPHVGWYSQRSAGLLRQQTIVDSIAAASAGPDPVAPAGLRKLAPGGTI